MEYEPIGATVDLSQDSPDSSVIVDDNKQPSDGGSYKPISGIDLPPPEKPGYFGTIVNGALKGFNDIRGLTDFAGVMASRALNLPGVEHSLLQDYISTTKSSQDLSYGTPGAMEDINSFDGAIKWGLFNIASNLPLFAVGGVGGGLGRMAAGKISMNTFGKMAEDVGVEEANKMIAKRIAIKGMVDHAKDAGTLAGSTAAMYPINAGDIGSNVYEHTGEVNPGLGFALGAPMSVLDAIPELSAIKNIFGEKIAATTFKELAGKYGKSVVKQGLLQGSTGATQGLIENIAVNLQDPNQGVFNKDGISNIVNSFGAAFLTGGVIGGLTELSPGTHPSSIVNDKQRDISNDSKKEVPITDEELNQTEGDTTAVSDEVRKQREILAKMDGLDQSSDEYKSLKSQLSGTNTPETDITKRFDAFVQTNKGTAPDESQTSLIKQQAENDKALEGPLKDEDRARLLEDNKSLDAQLAGVSVVPGEKLRRNTPKPIVREDDMGTAGSLDRSIGRNRVDSEIKTSLESLTPASSPEHTGTLKNAYTGILEPYRTALGEQGVKVQPRPVNDPSPEMGASMNDNGDIVLHLPHFDKVEAAPNESPEVFTKKAEEEVVHTVGQFAALRKEAVDAGHEGPKIKQYVDNKLDLIGAGLRVSTKNDIVKTVSEVYLKNGKSIVNDKSPAATKQSNISLAMEFGRMVLQRTRTGQITEDLQALDAVKNDSSATPEHKEEAANFQNKIFDGLQRVRESIARFFYKKTTTPAFHDWMQKSHKILDRYGIATPAFNRKVTQAQTTNTTNTQNEKENAGNEVNEKSVLNEGGEQQAQETTDVNSNANEEKGLINNQVSQTGTREASAPAVSDNSKRKKDHIYEGDHFNYDTMHPIQANGVHKVGRVYSQPTFNENGSVKEKGVISALNDDEKDTAHYDESAAQQILRDHPEVSAAREAATPSGQDLRDAVKADRKNSTPETQAAVQEAQAKHDLEFAKVDKIENRLLPGIRKQVAEDRAHQTAVAKADRIKARGNQAPIVIPPPKPPAIVNDKAIPANQISSTIGSMGSGAMENFYRQGIESLQKGSTVLGGLDDPLLRAVKPHFDSGEITTPSQLKNFSQSNRDIEKYRARPNNDIQSAPAPHRKQTSQESKEIASDLAGKLQDHADRLNGKPVTSERGIREIARGADDPLNSYQSRPFAEPLEELSSFLKKEGDLVEAANKVLLNKSGLNPSTIPLAKSILAKELEVHARSIFRTPNSWKAQDDAIQMRETANALNEQARMEATQTGRGNAYLAMIPKLYSAYEAVREYSNRGIRQLGKAINLNPGETPEGFVQDLLQKLTKHKSKVAEGVITSAENSAYVKRAIGYMLNNPDKSQRELIRALAKNPKALQSIQNAIMSAPEAKFQDGNEDHLQAMIQKIVADISFGLPRKNRTQTNADKILNNALTESARGYLKESGLIGKTEQAEKASALQKMRLLYQNEGRWNEFVSKLREYVADQYRQGVDDPAFKAEDKRIFGPMRDRVYSKQILAAAINEEKQNLEMKVNDLIKGTWGDGEQQIEKIIQQFQDKLKDDLSPEQAKQLSLTISAALESEMADKYLGAIGVKYDPKNGMVAGIKGMQRITDAIKDKEFLKAAVKTALGNQNLASQLNKLADITGLSMRGQMDLRNTLAQNWTERMGFPPAVAAAMQERFEAAMKAASSLSVDRESQSILDRLENAAVAKKLDPKKAKQGIDRIIDLANKGFLDEGGLYNAIRTLYPKLHLPEYNEDTADVVRERGEMIEGMQDGRLKQQALLDAQKFIDSQSPLTGTEIVTTWMYYSMLSSPTTSAVNAVSNMINLIGNIVAHGTLNPQRIPAMLGAAFRSATDIAPTDFKYTMKTGLTPGKTELVKRHLPIELINPTLQPGIDKLFTYSGAKILTRFLGATDVYFNQVANSMIKAAKGVSSYTKEEVADATRQANEEIQKSGLDKYMGEDVQRLAARLQADVILDNKWINAGDSVTEVLQRSQLLKNIQHYAQQSTFNQEPQGVGGYLSKLVSGASQDHPWMRAFVPFTHVVGNVFNEQMNWTPWGFLRYRGWSPSQFSDSTKDAWMAKDLNGNSMRDPVILAKAAWGSVMLISLTALAMKGIYDDDPEFAIYGSGPKDPNKRRQWLEQGGKPYSIQVGNTYISYLVSPVSMGLASIGTYTDGVRNGESPEGISDILARASAAIFNSMSSQSFLSGLQDIAGAASSVNPEQQLSRTLGRMASMPVPNLVKQVGTWFNPKIYDAKTVMEYMMKDIPVVNAYALTSMYNETGDPVERKGNRFYSTRTEDPLYSFLSHKGLFIPSHKMSSVLGNEQMTREQQTQYVQLAGPKIREAIQQNIGYLEGLDKEQAQDWISNQSSGIRQQVRWQMQNQ